MEHAFTSVIRRILEEFFADYASEIFEASSLLQYLNIKTKSASRGSKARPSFGNHYALYVLIEDYLEHGFPESGNYAEYSGARFVDLFRRQRELPFGGKLQNHALNHRLNEEFKRYFPSSIHVPILRNVETGRYRLNENLLLVTVQGKTFNIARAALKIIDAYIEARKSSFERFIEDMVRLQDNTPEKAIEFIRTLVRPEVDARIFEIVSFAILKAYYFGQSVIWGWSEADLRVEPLSLYKTGRTNANDGGIDFVMKPTGRFFQVTETVDVKKYFLDIDKIHRYPLTFVVKSDETPEAILRKIELQATRYYGVSETVQRYMNSIEEVINIPVLLERFEQVVKKGQLQVVIEEIILQSKVEFNYN